MDQIQKLKELITPLVAEDGIELYDVAWHTEGSMRILQVSIMHKDGSMDIDTCAAQSEKISTMLDEMDMIASEYFLEVCSPGAERELKSEEQIRDAIGEFVYVKLKNPRAGMDEIKGTLTAFENNTVYLDYMAKAVKKKAAAHSLTTSDKIDRIVTNRILALPIFAVVMFAVYYVAIGTVGDWVTGWTNDVLFGEIVPPAVSGWLEGIGTAPWLQGLIVDGIIAGVGAVLGFVPQMLVLFLMLSILEDVGYMARVAFIMDRIFRKFGLSGKSFIPMLIGSGCGVPGVMASRTIENERDRRMTVMTTCFVPCGAKMPIIGLFAGAVFGNSAWVATSAYFVGMAAIIISGIMLKKTKMFAGDPAPFVMELPAYHWPTVGNVLRSMWERGWSFIKKAGTIILLSTIAVWFTTYFGWAEDGFRMLSEEEIDCSILAHIGSLIAWIFAPLGWGNWKAAVASITGLVAKENIVGTLGILYGGGDETVYQALGTVFTQISGYSFLVFNLLCAPCFAAIGAIKREMNNAKWTWFAIGYQCGFAYLCALMVNQFGKAFTGDLSVLGLVAALAALAFILYMLVRPYKEATKLSAKV